MIYTLSIFQISRNENRPYSICRSVALKTFFYIRSLHYKRDRTQHFQDLLQGSILGPIISRTKYIYIYKYIQNICVFKTIFALYNTSLNDFQIDIYIYIYIYIYINIDIEFFFRFQKISQFCR